MVRLVLWRLGMLIPVLFGVALVSFLLVEIMPGDPLNNVLGEGATQQQRDQYAHEMGMDQPVLVQFFVWLGHLLHGDLGQSISLRQPVEVVMGQALLNTLQLALAAAIFGLIVGSILGTVAAAFRGGAVDRVVSIVTAFGLSIPNYWFGLILIWIFGVALRALPVSGVGSGSFASIFSHLLLPMLAVAAPMIGMITRMVRTQVIENLYSDHVDFLRSNGMPVGRLYVQVWRNTLPSVATIFGLELGHLLGGAALVEIVFRWPGVGQTVYNAVTQKDIPVVQAGLLLVGAFYVIINLVVDAAQLALDPRLRQGATV